MKFFLESIQIIISYVKFLSNQINDNDSEHYDINIYSNDAELMVSVGKGIQAGMMS